jgi:hypothetical protein
MSSRRVFASQHAKRLLHEEKRGKSNKNSKPNEDVLLNICDMKSKRILPYQYVSLLFHHYEMYTRVLMFAHECMRNQMKKDVGKQTTCLYKKESQWAGISSRHIY